MAQQLDSKLSTTTSFFSPSVLLDRRLGSPYKISIMTTKKILGTTLLFLVVIFVVLAAASKPEYRDFSYANTLDLKGAGIAKTEISFNAGRLNLTAHNHSSVALDATYTRESWKPEVKFNKQTSLLSILQPQQKSSNMKDNDRNEWEVNFPKNLETDLKLTIGAGEGIVDLAGSKIQTFIVEAGAGDFDINLANVSLSSLEINAGVGELTLDLSGEQQTDMNAKINGGVGAIKVVLPKETGLKVKVNGLGGINAHELTKQNGYYVNDLYGRTPHNIDMEINGGLGSLELSLQ